MEVSIHNTMVEARLKEDVTVFFYERVESVVRQMLTRKNASQVNTELALWDRVAREYMVPHQMLLFIKRRVGQGRQLWLHGIAEDVLQLFDVETKQYVDEKVTSLLPNDLSESDRYRLIVKVQRIIINNMDTAIFGIRTMSGR